MSTQLYTQPTHYPLLASKYLKFNTGPPIFLKSISNGPSNGLDLLGPFSQYICLVLTSQSGDFRGFLGIFINFLAVTLNFVLGRPKAGRDLKIPNVGGAYMKEEIKRKAAKSDGDYSRVE